MGIKDKIPTISTIPATIDGRGQLKIKAGQSTRLYKLN